VIRVRYSGPVRGAHMLSRQLSDAGLEAAFPPPMEQRGVGQNVVHVTMEIGSAAKDGVVGYAAVEVVKRIVDVFRERYPGVEPDVESDENE
jgi:hypothetical protein